jgi:MFS family permease
MGFASVTNTAIDQPASPAQKSPSYRSVLEQSPIRILATSRFFSRMGGEVMAYGIMVFLAAEGASQFEISISKSAAFVAALLFGLQGGLLADSRPKRQILLAGFALLGIVCFVTPFLLGTSIGDLLFAIFVSSAINQVVSPGFKSVVAIVSTPAELATTSALVNIVGSIGSSIGSTFIAPVLIKRSGIDMVLVVSGVLYVLSAIRIYRLPAAEAFGKHETIRKLRDLDWKPRALSLRYNANWIMANRPVASMLLVAVLSAALLQSVTALIPLYVRDVLDVDPTNSVYVFILSGAGFFVGAAISPKLIKKFGERHVAIWSLVMMAVSFALYSAIDLVDKPLAVISPLRLANLFLDTNLSDAVLAVGLLAFPANLGSTMCLQAVQVYINRTVPENQQGGVFGLQQVQENAFNLAAILTLGGIATITGPQRIFLFAPIIVGVLGLALITYSFRHTTGKVPHLSQSIDFLIEGTRPEEMHDVASRESDVESTSDTPG